MPEVKQYSSKPVVVEACRYGDEQFGMWYGRAVDALAEFIAGRELLHHEVVEYVRPSGMWNPPSPSMSTVEIQAGPDGDSGWVPVKLGDWVVRYAGDPTDHWPMPHGKFEARYAEQPELVDGGPLPRSLDGGCFGTVECICDGRGIVPGPVGGQALRCPGPFSTAMATPAEPDEEPTTLDEFSFELMETEDRQALSDRQAALFAAVQAERGSSFPLTETAEIARSFLEFLQEEHDEPHPGALLPHGAQMAMGQFHKAMERSLARLGATEDELFELGRAARLLSEPPNTEG